MGRRHSPASGRYPLPCTHLLRVGLCGFRDRRVPPENHRLADHLPASVHRPGPRRPQDDRLATKTSGADLSGLVHHLRPRRAVQVHPLRASPIRLQGGRLCRLQGRLLSALPWPRHSTRCTRPSSSFGQGPWQDIDAVRARHRRVGPLGGHHPPSLRHRHAHPHRAQSRPGTRHPPPGTTTTSHHRIQTNQPPQNPGRFTARSRAPGRCRCTCTPGRGAAEHAGGHRW